MPASALLSQLVTRIGELKQNFVPPLDPTGTYDDASYDRMRGFRLLVHAEIEGFLETRCLEVAKRAHDEWTNNQKHSVPVSALIAYYVGKFPAMPSSTKTKEIAPNLPDGLDGRLIVSYRNYNAIVRRENNGIKEENLLALLLPIGVRVGDLDATWVAAMNSFGEHRGGVAHTGKHTQQPIDPLTEITFVDELLKGLEKLDEKLGQLM